MDCANLAHDSILKAVHASIFQLIGSCTHTVCQFTPDSPELQVVDDNVQEHEAIVSATFSTLCHNLVDQNTPLLDEALTNMLIPMLGEWLNENLRSIVEALIDEEIERIAPESRLPLVPIEHLLGEPMGPVCSLIRIEEELPDDLNLETTFKEAPAVVGAVEIASDEVQSQFWLRQPARFGAEQSCSGEETEKSLRPRPGIGSTLGQIVFRRFAATFLAAAFFSTFIAGPAAGHL
jgi:hypothetical protein